MQPATPFDPEHSLWYRREAACWEEALPLGNGRIGAMVFGGSKHERIALNEDTLWSGYPACGDRRGAAKYYPIVRDLVLEGEYRKAQDIIEQNMQGADTQFYLPLSDLLLDFDTIDRPEAYTRSLSLRGAVCETVFFSGGATHRREAFVSTPDQALYLRLSVDKPKALAFSVSLTSKLRHRCVADTSGLRMDGICPSGMADREYPAVYSRKNEQKGMRFAVLCDVRTDGEIKTAKNGTLAIGDASFAVLRLFARTSFNGFDRHPFTDGLDERKLCRQDQRRAEHDYSMAKRRHMEDHQNLYNRCELHLDGDASNLSTDKRLQSHADGQEDDQLYALLFHYGRYLMIAGSREGTQPMNLQGIWNEHLCAPWRGNYTVNINTEMNYWPAEICNLSECHSPLFVMIKELLTTGGKTAANLYNARGAAVHHNTDIWRLSNPVSRGVPGSAEWAFWPMALGWLARHMTEHYDYTRDTAFLCDEALPVLRACSRFYLDILIDDGNGALVIAPATSPENTFVYNGQKSAVARSAQMSVSIVREVFTHYLSALKLLGIFEDMAAEARRALSTLPDYRVGRHGQLLEWDADYEETDPHHRHLSHLYDLFPGDAVSPEDTPELIPAFRQALLRRGDGGTGWSLAWKTNLWARLGDGEKALAFLRRQLHPVIIGSQGGGSYPNLMDSCPPFQIDGNFGACAGIAQMLAQSESDKIHLLPALPKRWTGHVRGLRLHGGAEADIHFHNGKAVSAVVRVPEGCRPPIVICKAIPVDNRALIQTVKA